MGNPVTLGRPKTVGGGTQCWGNNMHEKRPFSILRWLTWVPLLLVFFVYNGSASPVAAQTTAVACAVTPDKVDGQGFNVTGFGFNVTGFGFNVTQLGFNVTGFGFSVTQLGFNVTGFSVEQLVAQITNNVITPAWLTNQVPGITGGPGYNGTRTAILVVDDFSSPTAHGADVRKVFDSLYSALDAQDGPNSTPNILIQNVDMSSQAIGFRSDAIANAIRNAVDALAAQGIQRFVINMSFGLVPCDDATDVTLTDAGTGQTTTVTNNFSYAAYLSTANTVLNSRTKQVSPVLECVQKVSYGNYIAYWGYENKNPVAVSIPVGGDNRFHPTPQGRGQPSVFAAGRQRFVFATPFDGKNLVWQLKGPDGKGRTATASSNPTQDCARRGIVPPANGNVTEAPLGYGLSQYLNQALGIPANFVDEYLAYLAGKASEDPITGLQALLRGYLQRSFNDQQDANPSTNFAVIPVASSGNFRFLFGGAPLKPAAFPESFAISAAIGDPGTSLWPLSHDGNAMAPGGGFPFETDAQGKITRIGAGTSFAAPYFSTLAALWLTYPNACTFGNGTLPVTSAASTKASNTVSNPSGNSALNCAIPVNQADLQVTKTAPTEPVPVGGDIAYQVVVKNLGPGTAQAVKVTDTLPTGVSFKSITTNLGSCSSLTGICELGDMAVNQTALILVTVVAPYAESLKNDVSVASPVTPDLTGENNNASATALITLPPFDALDDDVVTAFNAAVTFDPTANDLPLGQAKTITSFTAPPVDKGVVTQNGNLLTFTPVTGASGQTSFTYTVADGRTRVDTATVRVTVGQAPQIDLMLTKDGPSYAVAGETVTFDITVENIGGVDATNVTVVDLLPAGMSFIGVSGLPEGASCNIGNLPYIVCQLGNLPDDAKLMFMLDVKVIQAGDIVNKASVTANQMDLNTGNNADDATVHVEPDNSNRPPVAVDDCVSIAAGQTSVQINVTGNDYDPDEDPIEVFLSSSNPPDGYTEIISPSTIVYYPATGFAGTYIFYYKIRDNRGGTAFTNVTVRIGVPCYEEESSTEPVPVEQPPVEQPPVIEPPVEQPPVIEPPVEVTPESTPPAEPPPSP